VIRFIDIILSLFAIVVTLPLMIPVMIALKLSGEHYVFYLQTRVGKDGKDFAVFKFATILKDSPNLPGGVLTQKSDPRILPMGNFLRKTKINELPQLINILLGSMSFVGPRPQARKHYELYSPAIRAEIDRIRPGLTGIGSVIFRDEENLLDKVSGNRDDFHDTVIAPYKGELEVWYSHHRGLWTYVALIFLTAWAVVRPGSRLYARIFRDLPPVPSKLESLF
jgi:lipopolysaccharide/colanic/teichoic acid biosynthesis glycosyltransferase